MEFGQKNFCEIDLFDFASFFGLDFFNFLAHCDNVRHQKLSSHWMVSMTSRQFTPVTTFFRGWGAGMVGILGYVMGGVYVTNVNNQNRWGCPYLSKNASCTLLEKNYKISMTWKITFQSESRFTSFPAPSLPLYNSRYFVGRVLLCLNYPDTQMVFFIPGGDQWYFVPLARIIFVFNII